MRFKQLMFVPIKPHETPEGIRERYSYRAATDKFSWRIPWKSLFYRDPLWSCGPCDKTLTGTLIEISWWFLPCINPFHATDLFWYPLKTSKNLRFSVVFWGYQKSSVTWNGLRLTESKNGTLSKSWNVPFAFSCFDPINSSDIESRYKIHYDWNKHCINPFHATRLFLFPLKTLENLWFSDVFRGV